MLLSINTMDLFLGVSAESVEDRKSSVSCKKDLNERDEKQCSVAVARHSRSPMRTG